MCSLGLASPDPGHPIFSFPSEHIISTLASSPLLHSHGTSALTSALPEAAPSPQLPDSYSVRPLPWGYLSRVRPLPWGYLRSGSGNPT